MGNTHSIRPSQLHGVRRRNQLENSGDLQRQLSLELSLHDVRASSVKLEGGNAFHDRMAPMPHTQSKPIAAV